MSVFAALDWGVVDGAVDVVQAFVGSMDELGNSRLFKLSSAAFAVSTGVFAAYNFLVREPRQRRQILRLEQSRYEELRALQSEVQNVSELLLARQARTNGSPANRVEVSNTARCITAAIADISTHADGDCREAFRLMQVDDVAGAERLLQTVLDEKSAESRAAANAAAAAARTLAALHRISDPTRALAEYERATAFVPDHVETWIDLGDTAIAAGQQPRARKAFERALEIAERGKSEAPGSANWAASSESARERWRALATAPRAAA